jgi:hypothetical protein
LAEPFDLVDLDDDFPPADVPESDFFDLLDAAALPDVLFAMVS